MTSKNRYRVTPSLKWLPVGCTCDNLGCPCRSEIIVPEGCIANRSVLCRVHTECGVAIAAIYMWQRSLVRGAELFWLLATLSLTAVDISRRNIHLRTGDARRLKSMTIVSTLPTWVPAIRSVGQISFVDGNIFFAAVLDIARILQLIQCNAAFKVYFSGDLFHLQFLCVAIAFKVLFAARISRKILIRFCFVLFCFNHAAFALSRVWQSPFPLPHRIAG